MRIILLIISLSLLGSAYSSEIVCGLASGYPPYQFIDDNGVTGIDAHIASELFKRLDIPFSFSQGNWDDVFNLLRTNKIDMITGMEITEERKKYFDFTVSLYRRYEVIIVLESSPYKSLNDLKQKKISGDRQSFIENQWTEQGIRSDFRIIQFDSKEESFLKLVDNDIEACIMPKAVAVYLSKKNRVNIRIIEAGDSGTPVALAVTKGNTGYYETINSELKKMIKDKTINNIYDKWFKIE